MPAWIEHPKDHVIVYHPPVHGWPQEPRHQWSRPTILAGVLCAVGAAWWAGWLALAVYRMLQGLICGGVVAL